jgi:hypothetical protein
MPIRDDDVEKVVAEISAGAEDPSHVSSVVGAFMQKQPLVGHYVSAHAKELSLEGVVLTLLHATVIARCVERASGRRLRVLQAQDLDGASREATVEALGKSEPALHGYLVGNLAEDDPTLGGARRGEAFKLLAIIARAFLDQIR